MKRWKSRHYTGPEKLEGGLGRLMQAFPMTTCCKMLVAQGLLATGGLRT